MEIALHELRPGACARVTGMNCTEALMTRLKDFGFVPGTELTCRYRSPGGTVTALELRQTVLAIRTRDLQNIRALLL